MSSIQSEMAITIVIITVLGGIRSLYGSFLGAVVYVALNTYLSDLWPYWQMLLGIALIGIVLFFKGGLHGAVVAVVNLVRRGLGRRSSDPVDQANEGASADVSR